MSIFRPNSNNERNKSRKKPKLRSPRVETLEARNLLASLTGAAIDRVGPTPASGPDAIVSGFSPSHGRTRPIEVAGNVAAQANGAAPATATSTINGYVIHQPANVNDGKYGNGTSAIGSTANTAYTLDFGAVKEIDTLRFGRDRTGGLNDRDPGQFNIAVSSTIPSEAVDIIHSQDLGFNGLVGSETVEITFPAQQARYLIFTVANSGAAIDEIEVMGQNIVVEEEPEIIEEATAVTPVINFTALTANEQAAFVEVFSELGTLESEKAMTALSKHPDLQTTLPSHNIVPTLQSYAMFDSSTATSFPAGSSAPSVRDGRENALSELYSEQIVSPLFTQSSVTMPLDRSNGATVTFDLPWYYGSSRGVPSWQSPSQMHGGGTFQIGSDPDTVFHTYYHQGLQKYYTRIGPFGFSSERPNSVQVDIEDGIATYTINGVVKHQLTIDEGTDQSITFIPNGSTRGFQGVKVQTWQTPMGPHQEDAVTLEGALAGEQNTDLFTAVASKLTLQKAAEASEVKPIPNKLWVESVQGHRVTFVFQASGSTSHITAPSNSGYMSGATVEHEGGTTPQAVTISTAALGVGLHIYQLRDETNTVVATAPIVKAADGSIQVDSLYDWDPNTYYEQANTLLPPSTSTGSLLHAYGNTLVREQLIENIVTQEFVTSDIGKAYSAMYGQPFGSEYGRIIGQVDYVAEEMIQHLPFYESVTEYLERAKRENTYYFDSEGNLLPGKNWPEVWYDNMESGYYDMKDLLKSHILSVVEILANEMNGHNNEFTLPAYQSSMQNGLQDFSGHTWYANDWFALIKDLLHTDAMQQQCSEWQDKAEIRTEQMSLKNNWGSGSSSLSQSQAEARALEAQMTLAERQVAYQEQQSAAEQERQNSRSYVRAQTLIANALNTSDDPRVIAIVERGTSTLVVDASNSRVIAQVPSDAIAQAGRTLASLQVTTTTELEAELSEVQAEINKQISRAHIEKYHLKPLHPDAFASDALIKAIESGEVTQVLSVRFEGDHNEVQIIETDHPTTPILIDIRVPVSYLVAEADIPDLTDNELVHSASDEIVLSQWKEQEPLQFGSILQSVIQDISIDTFSFADDVLEQQSITAKAIVDKIGTPWQWHFAEGYIPGPDRDLIQTQYSLGSVVAGYMQQVWRFRNTALVQEAFAKELSKLTGISVNALLHNLDSEHTFSSHIRNTLNQNGFSHIFTSPTSGEVAGSVVTTSQTLYTGGTMRIAFDNLASINGVVGLYVADVHGSILHNSSLDFSYYYADVPVNDVFKLAGDAEYRIVYKKVDGSQNMTVMSEVFTINTGLPPTFESLGIDVSNYSLAEQNKLYNILNIVDFNSLPKDNKAIMLEFIERHFAAGCTDPLQRISDTEWRGILGGAGQQCKPWLQTDLIKEATISAEHPDGITIGMNNEADASWIGNPPEVKGPEDIGGVLGGRTENVGEFWDSLENAQAGDMVQVYTKIGLNVYTPHTMVIGKIVADGIWVFDSNWVDTNTVGYHFFEKYDLNNDVIKATVYRIES